MLKRWLPPTFYNPITLLGMTVATVMFIITVILILLDVFAGFSNAYSGLITYLALPGMMFFGLFVALIGWLRARRYAKKHGGIEKLPVIDLNEPRQRIMSTSVALGGLILMALSGFGSYKGYEYTESVQFCGTTCHVVMEPEYATYKNSPHANVSCASCHIGEGVEWYLKSKMSGTHQLIASLMNSFERPIKTPVASLRPAKETCEKCHSPKHFFTQKLRTHEYYKGNEENTAWNLGMLVKIGGGEGEGDAAQGIHAHMYLNSTMQYVATDFERQVIPYVEMTDKNGKVTIYRDPTIKITPETLKTSPRRLVDCIDCHNRPTHIFRSSAVSMDKALSARSIDHSVPEIKAMGVEVLDADYKTKPEALSKISVELKKYYEENYADFMKTGDSKVESAIKVVQGIYSSNYFPEMRTDWRSHRDNIDHMRGAGCFRCHNNRLVSDQGKKITNDCNTCHLIVAQGEAGAVKTNYNGLNFEHPVDIGDEWKTSPCSTCHGVKKTK